MLLLSELNTGLGGMTRRCLAVCNKRGWRCNLLYCDSEISIQTVIAINSVNLCSKYSSIIMSGLSWLSSFIEQRDSSQSPIQEEDLETEEQQQQTNFELSEINMAVKKASEGALAIKTISTYRR